MNILFCGDHNAEDGILIATLSLLKNSGAQELHIYILTMYTQSYHKKFQPFSKQAADYLKSLLVKQNPQNTLKLMDCTGLFVREPLIANMSTHFTPYAMLRLFADEIPQLPNKILYLDADVIVRRSLVNFYQQDLTGTELVGVLDYWGRFFFHNLHEHKVFDYVNSGVLLLNLPEIRKTNLFARIRHLLQTRTVLMPDQTALNRYAREKKIAPRRYNEQYKLQPDTVIQHFTTSFRFWPVFHTLTVKPWDVQRVHKVLKLHEYDDILTNYLNVKSNLIKK
ncbi:MULTISPECIES: glycosyltransferase [Lactobacillus]|uniref:Glycosyl transferase n=1 Tax=Lactobacillus melliventris TaxID=1218507 RepID=A0A0F4LI05_9LACO|nr:MULTISPECIES: glycosyltransferase [Lactobacillus]KJY58472.1 Glycosyl transferase [Lactobacillus melliventris]MBH9988988.1 glycosyltransferase family 8 protein [Lactobacillus sp. M0392]MBI0023393.1 glycosyltransferase family 8 protein [Lactobacillus sp. W8171]MBI0043798.1 glycosyltransferase family 8 protein [Lactobacillus sp. M0393]RMC60566.1 glycosyltransferase family 8 protein [Lactobacillus sp. ESL0260]